MDREKIISEFERWCDEMDDECPVICLDVLALLKEQEARKKNRLPYSHDSNVQWT